MSSIFSMFGIFIIFLSIFSLKLHQREAKDKKHTQTFWNKESASNLTPVQDISTLNYVDFSGVALPFSCFEDEKLKQCEAQVLALKDQKILNLSGFTNTDLKLTYGAANLNRLMNYDQNFILLVRTLHQWGQRLYDLSCSKEAEEVLTFAVSIGSDIKASYELLLTLCQQSDDRVKIETLKQYASGLNTIRKNTILSLLEQV